MFELCWRRPTKAQDKKVISVIYLVNCYASPDQVSVGSATRHYHHVQGLSANGWQVDVITAAQSTISAAPISSDKTAAGAKVHFIHVGALKSGNLIHRATYHVRFFLRSLSRSLIPRKPSMVIASMPSLLIGWQGYLVSRLKRSKLILDVRDLWADSISTTQLARLPLFVGLNRLLEKLLYRTADVITCTSKAQVQEVRKMVRNGVPVFFVPNALDPEVKGGEPEPHPIMTDLRKKYRWVGLFAGKHSQYTALDTLLTAASQLGGDGFALVLVGGGYSKDALIRRAEREGIDNVYFHDPVPKKEVNAFLVGADFFFVNYSSEQVWEKVLPNKLFDYMYWNRPVIAAVVPGEITRVISESGGGISVPPENPLAIVEALRRYMNGEYEVSDARPYLLKHFDRVNTVCLFIEYCRQALYLQGPQP